MDESSKSSEASTIGSRDLMIGALIVGIGVATFAIGYWQGRDIGFMLFN